MFLLMTTVHNHSAVSCPPGRSGWSQRNSQSATSDTPPASARRWGPMAVTPGGSSECTSLRRSVRFNSPQILFPLSCSSVTSWLMNRWIHLLSSIPHHYTLILALLHHTHMPTTHTHTTHTTHTTFTHPHTPTQPHTHTHPHTSTHTHTPRIE